MSADPSLRAALICEQVLVERDGVLSAIRIVDRFTVPPEMPVEATLLLMLVTTEASLLGAHQVLLRIESPSGGLSEQTLPVEIPADAGL